MLIYSVTDFQLLRIFSIIT